ncbi:YrzI family small protein [Scopulibacillus cellulosilyticus]|uniref:YrzI family small protein n=1 Tax=Scopulibacillus cellulosilyticus TaxID=2665665 RepID=A0ABW2PX59_9BACL
MLKLNLFTFTLTMSIKRKRLTMQEYQDQKRIKKINEENLNKRLEHTPFL